MSKSPKRILAVLIVCTVVLFMFSISAMGASVETEAGLKDAINNASDATTITLATDISLTSEITIPSGKDITIDLAGHNITNGASFSGSGIIAVGGKLTINDSAGTGEIKNTKSGGSVIYAMFSSSTHAEITVNGGSIMAHATGTGSTGIKVNSPNCIVTVKGGKISGAMAGIDLNASSTGSEIYISGTGTEITGGYAVYAHAMGAVTVEITGGTITGKSSSAVSNPTGVSVTQGDVKISDATITAPQYGVYFSGIHNVTYEISGDTEITSTSYAIYEGGSNCSKFGTIKGGAITGSVQVTGDMKIEDGTFSDDITLYHDAAKLEITGGEFKGELVQKDDNASTIVVKGGRFPEGTDLTEYLPEGYEGETSGGSIVVKRYVAQVDDTKYETIDKAMAEWANGGTLTLLSDVEWASNITFTKAITYFLDLNGHTLDMGSKKLNVSGDLEIVDSKNENGKITGTATKLVEVKSGGNVTLASGTISSSADRIVWVGSGSQFDMTGGKIESTGSERYVVYIFGGDFSIEEGNITGSTNGVYLYSGTLTVGAAPVGTEQTEEEANKVYIEKIRINGTKDVTLNSGIIGDISNGTIGASSTVISWFENDVSGHLEAGLGCIQENNYWIVKPVTEDNAVAKIIRAGSEDIVYIADAVQISGAIQKGDTLVLLDNISGGKSGTAAIQIKAVNVTVDLNGFNVTNPNGGNGIAVAIPYGTKDAGTFTLVNNNSESKSKVTGKTPLTLSHGNSLVLEATIGENIELIATGENGMVELGSNARIPYSAENAALVNGGFKAVDTNEKEYIYGSLGYAVKVDADREVQLVGSYKGTDAINFSSGEAVLDLKGFTYEYTGSDAAIKMTKGSPEYAKLTIKNGTLISASDAGTLLFTEKNLIIDDVDITVNGSGYGFCSNGTAENAGCNLTLQNGTTLTAPNAIAIYWPSIGGKVTITDSIINAHTGIQVCAGNLTVNGTTEITATGTPVDKSDDPNQDGGIMDGSAVSVVKRDGYGEISNVEIKGGTFVSEEAASVSAYGYGNGEVSGWADADDVVAVSGGSFSSSVKDYVIDSLQRELYSGGTGMYSYYETADAAYAAAGPDDTIAILSNYDPDYVSVTLVFNNGVDPRLVTYHEHGTLYSVIIKPTRDGYTFLGWYLNGEKFENLTVLTEDIVIEAKWEKNSAPDRYDLTIGEAAGGKIEADASSAVYGGRITITVTADTGYTLKSITALKADGTEVNLEKTGENTYLLIMPDSDVTVEAYFEVSGSLPYIDVSESDWYYGAIKYAYDNGLMIGDGDIFEPLTPLTRAEMVQILYNLEGKPQGNFTSDFDDVEYGQWYTDAINWAASVKVGNGDGDGNFRPDEYVSREEMAQFMYNYAKYKGYSLAGEADLGQFTDGGDISDWAVDTMKWAVDNKIFIGNGDGTITPLADTIRGEAAQIVTNFHKNIVLG